MAMLAVKHAEIADKHAELAEEQKETARQQRETAQQLRELGKQLGGLGDKFGSFTEGLALPSMTKILMQQFGMQAVMPRARVRRNGRTMEIDVLAYSNSEVNTAFIVEVKSHLREDGLDQLRKMLRDFRDFFPEHAGKKVYGILAAVDIPEDLAQKVLREGIYLALIHDGHFELQVPRDFQPKAY